MIYFNKPYDQINSTASKETFDNWEKEEKFHFSESNQVKFDHLIEELLNKIQIFEEDPKKNKFELDAGSKKV